MSEPAATDRPLQAAPTLAEAVLNARRKRGEQVPQPNQPGSQIKVREMNRDNEPLTGPPGQQQNIQDTRRVQQPAPSEDPEQVQRAHEALGKRLFGERFGEVIKKQQEDKGTPQPKPAEKKQDRQQQPQPQAKPGVQVKKEAPRFTLTAEDIARLGSAAAEAVTKAQPSTEQAKETPQTPDYSWMDEEDAYNLRVAQEMQNLYPDRYKDLANRFVDVAKRKADYKKAWESENSGSEFDWDDEQHQRFLEEVEPKVSARHRDQARIRLEAKEVAKGELDKANERIKELEKTTMDVNLKDSAAKEASVSIAALQETLDPSGRFDLSTREGRMKAATEDKVFGVIMAKNADLSEAATLELVRLYDGKGKFKINPEKNNLHRFIVDVVETTERHWASSNEPFMNDQNQSFVPREEYRKMSDAQRRRHWTIGRAQAIWLVNDAIARNAQAERDEKLDELEAVAKAQGWDFNRESFLPQKKSGSAPQRTQSQQRQQPVNTDESEEDGTPPASVPPGSGDPASGAPVKSFSDISKTIVSRLFPREGR